VKLDAPKLKGKLFPASLPVEMGGLPQGLLGPSAQVCNACHPSAVAQWSASAHAQPPSPALRQAALGDPACLSCHLPLLEQQEQAQGAPNPAFDATLLVEGVTCGACHLREGAVVVGAEAAAVRPTPHQSLFSDKLTSSEACAPCHQLSLPGVETPLYDTYGQWKRSGFEAAGITCQSCHLTGAADGTLGADHRMLADPARALTVDVDLPTLRVVRGAAPVPLGVTLHNSGAGHHFPTGTPFRGMRASVSIEGPPDENGQPRLAAPPTHVDLQRRIEEKPPFTTLEDTTLPPAGSRRIDLSVALPPDAPPGPWTLRITVTRTLQGQLDGQAFVDRRWALVVE
jgi:hypothetical protein